MGKIKFFSFFESMVRDIFSEQGGWRPQAVFLRTDGKIQLFALSEEPGSDSASLISDMIRFNGFIAYGVAYQAVRMGSPAEDTATDEGNVTLDYTTTGKFDFRNPTIVDTDGPDIVLFLFMAASGGQSRARAFEIVEDAGARKIGKRLEHLEDAESPYADLFNEKPRPGSTFPG